MNEARRDPCRLHVLLAAEAPLAVVLRRGPSAWVRLSLWHTDTDTFEHGQWLHGRVYERRCDLSPDGSLLVLFIRQSRRDAREDSWVAVSRPPWFTALALWFVGGTYHSGGYFPSARSLWIGGTAAPDQGRLPWWLTLRREYPPYLQRTPEWTDRTVFINRLLRGGWERVEGPRLETWQRRGPGGQGTLLHTELGWDARAYGGPYMVGYGLQNEQEDELTPIEGATWADWDQRGRLLVARGGRLEVWAPDGGARVIEDFNPQKPGRVPPSATATTWPSAPRVGSDA
jgi:hypothetical protein